MTQQHSRRAITLGVALTIGLCAASAPARASDLSPAEIYRRVAPTVVFIFGSNAGRTGASGTGTVIDASGLILTNNHVIADDRSGRPYKVLEVYFKPDPTTGDAGNDLRNGRPATVVARDADLDLALLRVSGGAYLPHPIGFGRSSEVSVGESVAAIGHPQGGGLWTLTTGHISSSRTLGAKEVFQSQASLNPGNSGGPLLNGQGRLIGVNTAVIRKTPEGTTTEGLNFSVKSDVARSWLARQGVEVPVSSSDPEPPAAPISPRAEASTPQSETAPSGSAAATPRPTPTRPVPSAPRQAASSPEPPPVREPSTAPDPAPVAEAPAPTPSPSPRASAPPTGKPATPRTFRGPNDEEMFGVPQQDFDLEEVEKNLHARVRKKAASAFDELDDQDF